MKILFVTGTLAEPALKAVINDLAPRVGFEAEIAVLPISVAALMTPAWVARSLKHIPVVDRVILPGYCRGDLSAVEKVTEAIVELGPEDLRDLPQYFSGNDVRREDYSSFDIEILAEINHADRLSPEQLIAVAEKYRTQGADIIDLGCSPGARWNSIGLGVERLKNRGFRISVDSFDPGEVNDAVLAGAELVLSVNNSNRSYAPSWGVEVVVIPDAPGTLIGLDESIQFLQTHEIPFRIDPVLEPIGFGFAASLSRFLETRRRYPDLPIMMGVGNLTELTEVDSSGVNALLIGFCQELAIRSVLTTEEINWARSSIQEIDLSRRIMHYSIYQHNIPKHVKPSLLTLRDARVAKFGGPALLEMAGKIKDRNWRIFAEDGLIIAMNGSKWISHEDPFVLFEQMDISRTSHAFYLGYEMHKAKTALTLSKNYRQDQALDWGYLTEAEKSHMKRKNFRKSIEEGE